MNLLVDRLPDSIEVCGGSYAIHTDYRYWIRFETIMLDGTLEDVVKIATLLTLCYKELPPSLPEAFSAMLAFYLGRDMEGQGDGKKKTGGGRRPPVYSFEHDADYIYSAFWSQYRIDLQKEQLHWYQFKALFKSLSDDNQFVKMMEYRAVDLATVKDKAQKSFYRRMKALYRLPDNRTEAEKEKAMIDGLDSLFSL